jgi:acetyl-CoA carboxylase biotin carboxyl carrier protein
LAKSQNPTEPSSDTAQAQTDMSTVRRLVEIVVEHNLAELEMEADGVQINIKGAVAAVAAAPVHILPSTAAMVTVPMSARPHAASVTAAETMSDRVVLEAPMVGVFYQAASPNDPPFVNVGDMIRIGQTIGLIEAMKVYSEVPAEKAGRVVEIAVENGTLVHMGDPLIYLEP